MKTPHSPAPSVNQSNSADQSGSHLIALGEHLSLYRKKVLKMTQGEFSIKLDISEPTLRKMEKGDAGVSLGIWMKAFKEMQVVDAVVIASKPDVSILMSMFNEAEKTA